MQDKPVVRFQSLAESVHEVLRARILNSELPAGAPLLEGPLAEELGVSRATVKAALRELQSEGLVEAAPRRAARVTRRSEADIREVCFARYLLESACLRDMDRAERRDLGERMEAVVSVMGLCAEQGDVAGLVAADTELHGLVAAASGHPLVVDLWTRLNGQMGALMRSDLDRQHIDLRETVRRHAVLAAAFRERPPALADAALYDHYLSKEP